MSKQQCVTKTNRATAVVVICVLYRLLLIFTAYNLAVSVIWFPFHLLPRGYVLQSVQHLAALQTAIFSSAFFAAFMCQIRIRSCAWYFRYVRSVLASNTTKHDYIFISSMQINGKISCTIAAAQQNGQAWCMSVCSVGSTCSPCVLLEYMLFLLFNYVFSPSLRPVFICSMYLVDHCPALIAPSSSAGKMRWHEYMMSVGLTFVSFLCSQCCFVHSLTQWVFIN